MATTKLVENERKKTKNSKRQRKAFLMTKKMLEDAEETFNAKENAQASIALERIIKQSVRRTKEIATDELTKHIEKHFNTTGRSKNVHFLTSYILVFSQKEVISAVLSLVN